MHKGQPTPKQIVVASEALDALWFSLDEADAVARSIELVQEHVQDTLVAQGKIFALVRTICGLLDTAKGLQETASKALFVCPPVYKA